MSAAAVPLFDAARLREREPEELARLRAALSTVGFCRIARHPIPAELIAELASCRRAFFAQPEAAKRRVAIEHSAHFRGWSRLEGERTNANVDFKEFFDAGWAPAWGRPEPRAEGAAAPPFRQLQGPNQWPEETAALRSPRESSHGRPKPSHHVGRGCLTSGRCYQQAAGPGAP